MNYFVRVNLPNTPWMRVTLTEFRDLEKQCGFSRPTGGFNGGGITTCVTDTWPTKWDEEKREYVRDWNVIVRNGVK
jgi:hypothetical protein